MKAREQKTLPQVNDHPQKSSAEHDGYEGVQTFIGIVENNLEEVLFSRDKLMEYIFSPHNLNAAYLKVKSNKGASGVDNMEVEDLGAYLKEHKETLVQKLMTGKYKPNPVRRVSIPKGGGKERLLGIPTVVDRVIQQAITQILTQIYDKYFHSNSFGFRPRRGAHQAVLQLQRYAKEGYEYAVDLDLERFFDTVNHSKLIETISRTIKDGRVVSLIHKYLNAGVMNGVFYERSDEGMPQGSPLSPLLSNIMLNELDKELQRRGYPFVRYADDCIILCKSRRGSERTMSSITTYIESKLKLRVNRAKTTCGYLNKMKFLGYSLHKLKGE